ncbi:hypothetical protein N7513_010847 [Penicillium frequentans]|nr:hypothetical protein N7513_010847 [Penicillium glabrum]
MVSDPGAALLPKGIKAHGWGGDIETPAKSLVNLRCETVWSSRPNQFGLLELGTLRFLHAAE